MSVSPRFRAYYRCLFTIHVCLVFIGVQGCYRHVYRKQADKEAYQLIQQKVCHSGENSPSLRIDLDHQSRMFDPFDPDRPPMPQDDPKSHCYMHRIDGKRNYPMWHANGDTNTTENPDWWRYLPLDERGVLVLDSDRAFQLALLHSPDYQRQLETLYLSALDVSSERFLFDTQFFGGYQSFYTADGRIRGGGSSSSRVEVSQFSNGQRPWSMQRRFATGANLIVGMANSIVWDISGNNTQSASTVLDFSLIQPLLRRAGRDRVLATLTLSERQLLANVRAFERYRRSFFLNVTTGRSTDSGPTRRGGVFGVGLQGFTGLGGGFAGLGGGGGGGFAFGGANAQAGGFLGLLQDQLQIQNQEENVARLEESLLLLEDTLREMLTTIPADQEAIPRQRLQVAQQQQALLSARSALIAQHAAFKASIDTYLRTLGLPPYLCVEVRDPMLNQFQLISPELKLRRNHVTAVRNDVGVTNTKLLETGTEVVDPVTNLPTLMISWSDNVETLVQRLKDDLGPVARLQQVLFERDLVQLAADIDGFEASISERVRLSKRLHEVYDQERELLCTLLPMSVVDPSVFDTSDLTTLVASLRGEYTKLNDRVTAYKMRIDGLASGLQAILELDKSNLNEAQQRDLSDRIREDAILAVQDLLAEVSEDVLQLQLLQARSRLESVMLPEVDITAPEALEIARTSRRDWANARASLVDSWRLIEFNADDLESSLDVVFSGDLRNAGNNPFNIRSDNGRLRVGLQWDAPLTRLQERNTYRQSLIEFQQAKRSYYQFEDGVWQLLRAQLRQLRANQVSFELQRQAVRMAAQQISLNDDIRQLREARGLSSGPTAARDIITALNDLLNAQNGFLNIWVNYEVVRRNLNLDMGTMELTPDGFWIDPVSIRADNQGSGMSPVVLCHHEEAVEEATPGQIEF